MLESAETVSSFVHPSYTEAQADKARRTMVGAIHGQLRVEILSGSIRPGTILSQVGLAQRLGVSRTPLREALRMLHEEGLIQLETNRRARVASFDPEELDFLYATRILLESLALTLTIPRLAESDFDALERALASMANATAAADLERWEVAHRVFHDLLTSGAGQQLRTNIARYADRSQRYRAVYLRGEPRAWSIGAREHEAILEACRQGVPSVAAHLSRHLARTALSLIAYTTPEFDPRAIRTALRLIQQEGDSM